MKMFVFDDVLHDYTSGMAVIAAQSLEEAQQLAFERFGDDWRKQTFEEFRERSGFGSCQGEYELHPAVAAGIKHYVYGGG